MKHIHDKSTVRSRRPLHLGDRHRLDLARHLAGCGARPLVEVLIAVERGASVDSVLRDFARLPAGCDRPRLPAAAKFIAITQEAAS